MKLFISILTLGLLLPTLTYSQDQEIDSSEDEKKVKTAVVKWADETFLMHKEYKFEHFKAFYTEEFFIATMREQVYGERVTDLEKKKASGKYTKSDEDYEKEHADLKTKHDAIKTELDNMTQRVTHFQIHFWSNIQTNDGITVYYEHILKLDNDYKVTEATINSAIGKKSENTQIVYKKDVKNTSGANNTLKSSDLKRNNVEKHKVVKQDDGAGSVTIVTEESGEKEDVKEEDTDSKKKKKKKKKKK